jgi:hypothetical protein
MSFIFRPGGTNRPVLKQIPYYTAFNPRSIGTCALWLDAADPNGTGVQPSDGTTITTWIDKSGTSNHGTSGTATFQRDSLGPCINFTGSQSYTLTNSNGVVNQYFTIFVVEQLQNYAGGETGFMGGTTGAGNQNLHMRYVNGGGGIKFGFYANDLDGSLTAFINNASQPIRIWSFSFTASSRVIYLNGVSLVSDANNTYISGWSGAKIGSILGGQFYTGKMREVMIYSGTVGTTQRQQIESYLVQKWPISVSLPSDHLHTTKPAGIPAVSIRNTRGFNLIAALLSGFMSTYYNLSGPYALVNIANSVSANSASIVNIWSVSVPTAAKGKNGILALFFNLYASAFSVGQVFDYGVYIDGVSQLLSDTGTIRYTQSTASTYALSSNGVTLGTNGLVQLLIPVSFLTSASQIQIGLRNSTAGMTPINSALPGYTSNILTSSGTSNTANFVPQTLFTTGGSNIYTVPTNTTAGVPTGVFVYLWGCGGQTTHMSGGGGGFVSGYYSCAPGTNLLYVVGSTAGTAAFYGGGGSGQNQQGGGFSGLFRSNAGGIVQSNAIAIAGGGGAGVLFPGGDVGSGWGGYPNGGAVNIKTGNVFSYSATITGGTQTSGGLGATALNNGGALIGGAVTDGQGRSGPGGGGWYGGGGNAGGGNGQPGAGGSGYIGNVNGATGGVGLTANAAYENGTDLPLGEFLAGNSVIYTRYPGGRTSPYYASPYGQASGANPTGAVVIIPAIGTSATQIGVSAALYSG